MVPLPWGGSRLASGRRPRAGIRHQRRAAAFCSRESFSPLLGDPERGAGGGGGRAGSRCQGPPSKPGPGATPTPATRPGCGGRDGLGLPECAQSASSVPLALPCTGDGGITGLPINRASPAAFRQPCRHASRHWGGLSGARGAFHESGLVPSPRGPAPLCRAPKLLARSAPQGKALQARPAEGQEESLDLSSPLKSPAGACPVTLLHPILGAHQHPSWKRRMGSPSPQVRLCLWPVTHLVTVLSM
ncbi:cell death-inducing p53-target protein 1 isoform X3 [Ahaetulla prasina]|uniref:cell death-inducing p53-target protein 1 isoform X3 n=1 Tax=Ahaetulla prasina TaxID=499056 RepID=UPI0026490230|nr:cell death-inducing p53-target protein 1 isoform X3 [Ahaetulla prasina]